jgi:hypothetical protein
MKKVLFGIIGLGAIVSLVVVMSCGGSGGGNGVAPTDAGSVAVASAVSAALAAGGNPLGTTSIIDEAYVNSGGNIPVDISTTCPAGSGTIAVTGNLSSTDTSVNGTLTEVLTNCAVEDAAPPKGCGFGNVVSNGTITVTINASGSQTSYTVSETMAGTGLTFAYDSKTLTCDIDLALNINSSTTYTEANIANAITGTICGVDWTQIQAALQSASQMETLCTALSAKTTEL